jgi:hypothetical protein
MRRLLTARAGVYFAFLLSGSHGNTGSEDGMDGEDGAMIVHVSAVTTYRVETEGRT